jgi:hypothetical protein
MIQKISKLEEIKAKLRMENEVVYLNQEKHIQAILEMNKRLELFRMDSQKKEKNSQISAASVILTA